MTNKNGYDVRLNHKSLTDAAPSIYIVDVTEEEPKEKAQTAATGTNGTRLLRVNRESLSVAMDFVLRDQNPDERAKAYNRVMQWARGGGYLYTSDRPGQRLYVDRVELPGLGSVKKWAGVITARFLAYARPYWESAFPAVKTLSGTNAAGQLVPPGNADGCFVAAEVTVTGMGLNTLTLTAGESVMQFTGLGLARGQKLSVVYRADGLLQITANGQSAMSKRSGADDLELFPGVYGNVGFSSDAACNVTFRTWGRWV